MLLIGQMPVFSTWLLEYPIGFEEIYVPISGAGARAKPLIYLK
jgi:hypothetical protein